MRQAGDAASHGVGRVKLNQRLAHINRYHVSRTQRDQRANRHFHRDIRRQERGAAERYGRQAEYDDRRQHLHADIVLHRANGKEQRDQACADCGRSGEMSQPL